MTAASDPAPDTGRLVGARLNQLELEHEAVWLLGLVGGREAALRDRVADELDRHLAQRDVLLAVLDVEDVDAGAPRASYGVPPADADAARLAIADVERRLSAACLAIVPLLVRAERGDGVEAVAVAARAAVRWGESPRAFPGLD
ncbi:hypothetical protein GCM10009821_19380 [Aeromicrobium halocynthiae]|uniref:DUF4439 domain-containing protein n=1 Tax=Aeromicrobium halocynthiae TaxID=560557 RepID=A0ABN2W0D8_9ACTN